MQILELERALDQLATGQNMGHLQRALKTYQLLRGLRTLIDEADGGLIELSQQRDEALISLGEAALRDLESETPTLDRTAFAETLDVLRRDLETVTGDADIARQRYESTRDSLDVERAQLNNDVIRLDDEITRLESVLRELPDTQEDREPHIEVLAENMVSLRDQLSAAERRLERHESMTERTLSDLQGTAHAKRKAVAHLDGRVKTVIRDLGRSILGIEHDLAQSDPAVLVRSHREEMRQIRRDRDKAVELMERVNTTPIIHFLGAVTAAMAILVSLGFWLF